MHVGVEASRLAREERGIGSYVRALVPRLLEADPALTLTFYAKDPAGIAALEALWKGPDALIGFARHAHRMSARPFAEAARTGTALTWYPWNVVRPTAPEGPVVVTMHDVVPVAMPDPRWHAFRSRWKWRRLFSRSAQRATRILADSAFTKREIIRLLGASPDRVVVALLGGDDPLPAPAADRASTLARLGVRGPFVMCVGADEPRKCLPVLRAAMLRVRAAGESVTLVCAGPRKRALIRDGLVHELGFVSSADLATLYAETVALVIPSSYEGFGLPLLEAMAAGAPAVSARAASLPEVGGDAVEYVESQDEAGLADAIVRLARDDAHRRVLAERGRAQAARFRWSETAALTLQTFRDAVQAQ